MVATTTHPDPVLADAQRALALVDSQPHEALLLATSVLAEEAGRAGAEASVLAHRAAGLALRETGDAASAREHLSSAVRIARRSRARTLEVECRISLAFLESEAGRTSRALAILDACDVEVGSVDEVRIATTRGLALQRVGRHAQALRQYDRALDLVARTQDQVQKARILNNRAMSLAYLGETDRALLDLRDAGRLYDEKGARSLAADTVANEAWVLGMAGDVPASLRAFDRARSVDPEGDDPERWTDRAEIYLRAGLHTDAARSARRAVDLLDGLGWEAPEAEAVLLLARCRLAQGDHARAAEDAARAATMLRRQGRLGWAPLAEYVRTRAEVGAGVVRSQAVREVADDLWDAGWKLAAVDLRLAAAVTTIAQGRTRTARSLLEDDRVTGARRGAPELRSRTAFARALSHELGGRPDLAQRLLRRSFREIERRRALLGAADMRALSSTLATDVVDAGLRLAVVGRDARELFAWSERSRAATFRYRPALPATDDALRDALTRLRWATRAVEDSRLSGVVDRVAAAEAARWEGEVMRRARRVSGDAAVSSLHLGDVRRNLDRASFVHLAVHQDRVVSAVLTARTLEMLDHGEAAQLLRLARRVLVGTARAALGGDPDERAQERLAGLLWEPVAEVCAGRRIVVSAPTDLADIPWGAVPGFADHVMTVAPSAQAWLSAVGRARAAARVTAIAGPGLPAAAEEVSRVAAAYGRGRVLVGEESTAAALLRAFTESDVVHVAAHGRLRQDNPLFSSLELHDGPVTAYDLEQLTSLPCTVVLSSCHAGGSQVVAPGESLGLASTLLRLGVRTVVAPVCAVDDRASVPVMARFHALVAAGRDPAAALAEAQSAQDPTARAFVAYGA